MDERQKKEILNKIILSSPTDWDEKSYSDHPYVGHSKIGFYKPDTSVVLAWGYEVESDFKAPWANKFPEPRASSHYVDIFYNIILLERFLYVDVDGGRAMLPLVGSLKTKSITYFKYVCLIQLLNQIRFGSGSQYESYFKRAGLEIPKNNLDGNLIS
jgi:hypothetical protein